jgi:hypothetical protein
MQHGRTPLDGLHPTVTIEDESTGTTRSFPATPAGERGVYEAEVVFPAAGDWRLVIDSSFGDSRLTYGPFTITAPVTDAGSRRPFMVALAAIGSLTLVAAAAFGVRRHRRLEPASG